MSVKVWSHGGGDTKYAAFIYFQHLFELFMLGWIDICLIKTKITCWSRILCSLERQLCCVIRQCILSFISPLVLRTNKRKIEKRERGSEQLADVRQQDRKQVHHGRMNKHFSVIVAMLQYLTFRHSAWSWCFFCVCVNIYIYNDRKWRKKKKKKKNVSTQVSCFSERLQNVTKWSQCGALVKNRTIKLKPQFDVSNHSSWVLKCHSQVDDSKVSSKAFVKYFNKYKR